MAESVGEKSASETRATSTPASERPPQRAKPRSRGGGSLRFYAVVAVAAVLGALLIWQLVSTSRLERRREAERVKLVAAHAHELDVQATQLLRATGIAMRLAITDRIAAGDYQAVGAQTRVLVREEPIMAVVVADEKNVIRSSTDYKLEGQKLVEAFPRAPVNASRDVAVRRINGGFVAIIPLRAAGQVIGRAAIVYRREDARDAPTI